MCDICMKIFNKSENRGIARKSRGGWQFFFYRGKILLYRGAEPLGKARKSRGAETLLETMGPSTILISLRASNFYFRLKNAQIVILGLFQGLPLARQKIQNLAKKVSCIGLWRSGCEISIKNTIYGRQNGKTLNLDHFGPQDYPRGSLVIGLVHPGLLSGSV